MQKFAGRHSDTDALIQREAGNTVPLVADSFASLERHPLLHQRLKIGKFPAKDGKIVQATLRDVALLPSDTLHQVQRLTPLKE